MSTPIDRLQNSLEEIREEILDYDPDAKKGRDAWDERRIDLDVRLRLALEYVERIREVYERPSEDRSSESPQEFEEGTAERWQKGPGEHLAKYLEESRRQAFIDEMNGKYRNPRAG
jgi:hypothetical protein